MRIDENYRLTASINPEHASNKTIHFSSSNPEVASVTERTYHPDNGTTSVLITAVITWIDPDDSDLQQIKITGEGSTVIHAVYADKGTGTITLTGLDNG
jgi:uncharacterized protein YjdB